jgi:hypothetical protein
MASVWCLGHSRFPRIPKQTENPGKRMTNADHIILMGQLAIIFALRDLILELPRTSAAALHDRAENLKEVAEAIREAIRKDL